MLRMRQPRRTSPGSTRGRARRGATLAIAMLGTGLAAGCAAPARAGPLIQLTAAQITKPSASGITDVYVQISNNGPATTLIAARVSVGGQITFRAPARTGQAAMRTIPSIAIPAKSLVRLAPNGSHLLVTDAGTMKSGTEITLTLVFAHAGAFSVPAIVTNPQSGGASYFLN